jgi:hypothetical protein
MISTVIGNQSLTKNQLLSILLLFLSITAYLVMFFRRKKAVVQDAETDT